MFVIMDANTGQLLTSGQAIYSSESNAVKGRAYWGKKRSYRDKVWVIVELKPDDVLDIYQSQVY